MDSLEYLLGRGIEVAAHDQALVERFLQGLDPDRHRLVSPRQGPGGRPWSCSATARPAAPRSSTWRLTAAGVDVAFRRGNLRVSPHLYNTPADIDWALEAFG